MVANALRADMLEVAFGLFLAAVFGVVSVAYRLALRCPGIALLSLARLELLVTTIAFLALAALARALVIRRCGTSGFGT